MTTPPTPAETRRIIDRQHLLDRIEHVRRRQAFTRQRQGSLW